MPIVLPKDIGQDKAKLREIVQACKGSYYLFLEYNPMMIVGKTGQMVRLTKKTLTKAQRAFVDEWLRQDLMGQPVRIITLKARQQGLSTVEESLLYWKAIFSRNTKLIVMAHESKSSTHLFGMFKTYHQNSLPIFKPSTTFNTKHDLTFNKVDEAGNTTGLNTVIDTATAGNRQTGRSNTFQHAHLSEVAFWADGSKIAGGLIQAIPMEPGTSIVMESTANGIGDYFHSQWVKATTGQSAFTPLFFPWFFHDHYTIEDNTLTEDELDSTEKALMKDHQVTIYQLAWRRFKIRELGGDLKQFMMEYPATPEEAFFNTGGYVFDQGKVNEMYVTAQKHPPLGYFKLRIDAPEEAIYDSTRPLVSYKITVEELFTRTALKIWQHPESNKQYVIGGDISEGVVKGDWSVATVIDTETNTVVARYRGKVPPEDFGDTMVMLGMYYNTAKLGPEVNNHGISTTQQIRNRGYPNLYMREKGYQEITEMPTSRFGWKTTRESKAIATNRLASMIRESKIIDYDLDFLQECSYYMEDERNRRNAATGHHDDTVMATAIAVMLYDTSPRKEVYEHLGGVYDPYENGVMDLSGDVAE